MRACPCARENKFPLILFTNTIDFKENELKWLTKNIVETRILRDITTLVDTTRQ